MQVNVSTIAGSRHVGPIKPRVEDWEKQLALFSETLVCICTVHAETTSFNMFLLTCSNKVLVLSSLKGRGRGYSTIY